MKMIPIAALALLAASSVWAEGNVSAKALFYGTDGSVMSVATTAPAPAAQAVQTAQSPAKGEKVAAKPALTKVAAARKAAPLGASYFIRLKRDDGTTQDVLSSRVFRSGERFQLGVKVNKPTYVYIYNRDDAGKLTQLYPQPNQTNFVDAMGVVFFPSDGSFQFDAEPGNEQLMVYLSPQPVNGLESRLANAKPDLLSDPTRMASGACTTPVASSTAPASPANSPSAAVQRPVVIAMADTTVASKGIAYSSDNCGAATVASKGIVFSDDATPSAGGQVASYVVKHQANASDPLHLQLKLVHR